jgi:alcohol dehydrogenase (cytochrome c)
MNSRKKQLRVGIGGLLLLGLALLVAACGGAGGTVTTSEDAVAPIATAPAFSSEELAEQAGDNWITNGGSTTNDRYSTLDEINTENVSQLKGDYVTKIGKEATAAKFSAEGQALEYEGTIYIPDGGDNVYAIDAGTGRVIWTYEPHLPPDPLGEVICCGWDNRGVAIGDGMVFVSQLNGDQVALDQETGKVKWSTPIVKPKSGYSITSAPLYYNGMLYVGGSGGEYGIRGRLTALDATTGEIKWKSYTIPAPGEKDFKGSWPSNNDAWQHGGAGIWNTPTVDPKTETLFFSTSNAGPDWNGAERAGDNKWAASIVAMDAKTGKIKWGYQQVHHDLWDYDSPSPTVLMEGEMNGEDVKAVGELGLPARPRNRQADLPDPRGEGPAGPVPEDLADAAGADDGTVQPAGSQPGIGGKSRRSRRRQHAETEGRRHEDLPADVDRSLDDQPDAELGGRRRQLAAVLV